MSPRVPIFLAQAIADLPAAYLWLGGGDTDIKLRVSIKEIVAKVGVPVVIADISNSK